MEGGVGVGGDQLPQPVEVGSQGRLPLGARRAGSGLARVAPPLLEEAHPGRADGVLGGDGAGRQAAVAVGQHALAQVEGVGTHGILRRADARKVYPFSLNSARSKLKAL